VFCALLISPDENLNREFEASLKVLPELELIQVLTTYPNLEDLLRTIRVRRIDVLFLSVADIPAAEVLASGIDDALQGFPIVAISREPNLECLRKLMRLGIRDYLTSPFSHPAVVEVVDSIRRRLNKHPVAGSSPARLYTFFPAKPGVGTSTVAVGSSCADLGARTLLLDCDLEAGAIQFLLKLGNSCSVLDALDHAEELDEDLLRKLVGRWHSLDVLHAGDLDLYHPLPLAGLQRFLSSARLHYDAICADLPSSLDRFSVEMMRESHRIFLVTTPEAVPLHLASRRMAYFRQLGLADRVRLLLNRKDRRKGQFTDSEVAEAVGLAVTYTFSNDYTRVQHAIIEANPVFHSSDLGRNILAFAKDLVPHLESTETRHTRRFLEFFHVPRFEDQEATWHD